MNTAKIYRDSKGNECSIIHMVRREQHWAANRIQEGEYALEQLEKERAKNARMHEFIESLSRWPGLNGEVVEEAQELLAELNKK